MSRTLTDRPIETLQQFMGHIESKLSGTQHQLWYRGVGNVAHDLLPGLYRKPPHTDAMKLRELENRMVTWFRHRSIPFQARSLDDNWECLFVMQHFGVPTRLLDWSENPYVALYFALSYNPIDEVGHRKVDAALWTLNPLAWNQALFDRQMNNDHGIISHADPLVNTPYEPTGQLGRDEPAAIYGSHNSPRIVAQRGVFTIFGSSIEPMNEIFKDSSKKFPADCLERLVIPAAKIDTLLSELWRIGVTESVVFPDLEGLGRETKRTFGFGGGLHV